MSSSSRYGSSADSGVPGLDREPGRPPGRPDALQGRLDRLLDLDVEGDRVAAGLQVLVEEATRLVDHQMGIERQLGPLAQVLDGLRAERQVGDEVGVHDVKVDAVRPGCLDAADGVGQVGKVRVEDARRDSGPTVGHGQSPTPAGTGSWLRSPRSAAALSATRRARRRATTGGGGSPARSAASWPHAAPTSCPRLRRMVVSIPAARRVVAKLLDDRHRAGGPRRVGDRVHRDQVDVGVIATQQVGHRGRVELGVVHASDHGDLVRDAPPGGRRMIACRGDHLGDRPAPVERDQDIA